MPPINPRDIAKLITEDPDIVSEDYCDACGGWDKEQWGTGHKIGCPVGEPNTPIATLPGSVSSVPVQRARPGRFKITGSAIFVDPDDASRSVDNCDEVVKADSVEKALLQAADGYLEDNLDFSSVKEAEEYSGRDVYVNEISCDEENGVGSYNTITPEGSTVKIKVERIGK